MSSVGWWTLALVALVGAALTASFFNLRRQRLLQDTPTSKVKAVYMGLNEVKGACRADVPLRSDLAGVECAWFTYTVEEHYRRRRTVTRNGRTTTETYTGWEEVDSGGRAIAFDVEDDTGRLRIRPNGATVHPVSVFDEEARLGESLYNSKAHGESVRGSTGRRRFSEDALPIGVELYVIGPARLRDDVVAPEIAEDEDVGPFIISTRPEQKLINRSRWTSWAFVVLALAGAVALAYVRAPENDPTPVGLLGYPAIVLLVLVAFWFIATHNSLVLARERAERAWTLIDIQLRRRFDLIPALAATAQGYAEHEQAVLSVLAEARAGGLALPAEEASPDQAGVGSGIAEQQTVALRSLLAVAEAYPDLAADEVFGRLRAELVDTEDRIALAREFYNESVRVARDRGQAFPASVVARLTGYRTGEYFEPNGFERALPQVDA
jgi:hypothetical protein